MFPATSSIELGSSYAKSGGGPSVEGTPKQYYHSSRINPLDNSAAYMDENGTFGEVRDLVVSVLQLGDRGNALNPQSLLLGHIPEFDSMAVVSVITALEEHFDLVVADDELSAETFESLATLTKFVETKVAE